MEPSELDDWAATVSRAIGAELHPGDIAAVLDLARDVAHGVARPAAPLTAYLAGVAVGAGRPLADVVADVTALLAGQAGTEGADAR